MVGIAFPSWQLRSKVPHQPDLGVVSLTWTLAQYGDDALIRHLEWGQP